LRLFRSVHQRTIDGDPRTNNYVEASHKRVHSFFAVDHPSVARLIEGLKKLQLARDTELERFVAGMSGTPRKTRRIQESQSRIGSIVNDGFEARTPLECLRGIVSNFSSDS
jgi:hypothetical protein